MFFNICTVLNIQVYKEREWGDEYACVRALCVKSETINNNFAVWNSPQRVILSHVQFRSVRCAELFIIIIEHQQSRVYYTQTIVNIVCGKVEQNYILYARVRTTSGTARSCHRMLIECLRYVQLLAIVNISLSIICIYVQ